MIKIRKVSIGNLKFDCRVSGEEENELVIFLHGFPETSFMWEKLMDEVSKLGFYCVAPNQRGFSKGACPVGRKNYTLDKLANDVMNFANFFGQTKFHLMGHDWGAAIGWKVVHDHPNAILSWTGISVPHIQSFGNAIFKDQEQRKMSGYIKSFQWPFLPEKKIKKNDFELFRKLWVNSEPNEVKDYLSVFKNKGTLTASLNYYRSNYSLLKKATNHSILGDIHVPTLFIWGNKDTAIGSTAVENGHKFMKSDYVFLELDGNHWLIQTKYPEISEALRKHLLKYRTVSNIVS